MPLACCYQLLAEPRSVALFLKRLPMNSWDNRIGEAVATLVLLAEYVHDRNFF
jgi:hypothetical protein